MLRASSGASHVEGEGLRINFARNDGGAGNNNPAELRSLPLISANGGFRDILLLPAVHNPASVGVSGNNGLHLHQHLLRY